MLCKMKVSNAFDVLSDFLILLLLHPCNGHFSLLGPYLWTGGNTIILGHPAYVCVCLLYIGAGRCTTTCCGRTDHRWRCTPHRGSSRGDWHRLALSRISISFFGQKIDWRAARQRSFASKSRNTLCIIRSTYVRRQIAFIYRR